MVPSRPWIPRCVGVRTVDHVDGALEEFDLWEMEMMYMIVLPTPAVVEQLYVDDSYISLDFSLLDNESAEPRRVCLGLVYRLMLQQFMLKFTRVWCVHGDDETRKRDDYLARLTRDYDELKKRFRDYYRDNVVGTEAVRRFRMHALDIEVSWMREVRAKYGDIIDLEYETVWLEA